MSAAKDSLLQENERWRDKAAAGTAAREPALPALQASVPQFFQRRAEGVEENAASSPSAGGEDRSVAATVAGSAPCDATAAPNEAAAKETPSAP